MEASISIVMLQEPPVGKFFNTLVVFGAMPIDSRPLSAAWGAVQLWWGESEKWWQTGKHGCCGHTLFQRLSWPPACDIEVMAAVLVGMVEMPPRMAGHGGMASHTIWCYLWWVICGMVLYDLPIGLHHWPFSQFHWFRMLNAWVKSGIILAILLTTFFLYSSFINLLVTNHQWHVIGDLPALSSSTVPWQMSGHHPRTWSTGNPSFPLPISANIRVYSYGLCNGGIDDVCWLCTLKTFNPIKICHMYQVWPLYYSHSLCWLSLDDYASTGFPIPTLFSTTHD